MNAPLTVQLRFFARVREQLGCSEETVTLPAEIATVGDVRHWLIGRGGAWARTLAMDNNIRMAYQHVMCNESEPLVKSGSTQEIAFFPPVTGG